MLWGGFDILVCVVGVSDSVFLPSISIGLVELLWISMLLFLMDARVGGGQLLDLLASTSISWSGRFVLTDRWSPGRRILLVFMDISLCCVLSGCVLTSGTWSLGNSLVSGVVLVLIGCVLTSGTWSLGTNLVSGVVLLGCGKTAPGSSASTPR